MGLLNSIGNALNKITGASSSARTQFDNQMALQKDAQKFAKWQMGNAHTMEVQDLENAGLNPVLSAGGSGASAGVTEGSASQGAPAGNPLEMILTTAKTVADINKQDAETKNINADTKNKEQTFELTPDLTKSIIDMNNASSALSKQKTETEFYNTINAQTESYMKELAYRAQEMDYNKRKAFYDREVSIYLGEMQAELKRLGIKNTEIYQALDLGFETAGKVFRSVNVNGNNGHNTNITKTYNTNSPTVHY